MQLLWWTYPSESNFRIEPLRLPHNVPTPSWKFFVSLVPQLKWHTNIGTTVKVWNVTQNMSSRRGISRTGSIDQYFFSLISVHVNEPQLTVLVLIRVLTIDLWGKLLRRSLFYGIWPSSGLSLGEIGQLSPSWLRSSARKANTMWRREWCLCVGSNPIEMEYFPT